MAKREEDSKEKEKIALEKYLKEQVEIAKDLITGTEVFLNTIKGIPHEYVMTSIIVANSITQVIQYNKDLLNKPQEDVNLKSKINYNIAEALLVYLSCDKSKYDEIVKRAINYYFQSGTGDALKKITQLDQGKTWISAKAHYQMGDIHFSHIKHLMK
jgi:hypothetical protein